MIEPPIWDQNALETDCAQAIVLFRQERLQEPLEHYLATFDNYQGNVEELLSRTANLLRLDSAALELLADPRLLEAFRYLTGPPISTDDLKTVADVTALNPRRLAADAVSLQRVIDVVRTALDRRRFPWVQEQRAPTADERKAAVLASAALMAVQRVATGRRHQGKRQQETKVRDVLVTLGWQQVPARRVETLGQAPSPGEFCGESVLGSRKADFIVRLFDQRLLPIECKVSNSSINSVKRLNNDAAAKAVAWLHDFGQRQIVPVAVLSGVYKLANLIEAQERGLTLFWAHDLGVLTRWIDRARPS